MLTNRFSTAVALAVEAHAPQKRKGTDIPYIAHPLAVLNDLIEMGPRVFDRFTAKQEGTLWYYRQLADIFTQRSAPMAKRLAAAVSEIERLAVSAH